MTALSVGMQLESSGMQFYEGQAGAASDQVVKQFFHELAEWESSHYQTLQRQFDLLKADYFGESGLPEF